MNYKMIFYTLGWILIFSAAFMTVPMITAIIYAEGIFFWFLGVAVFSLVLGKLLTQIKRKNKSLYAREGFIIVALSWITLSLFGAIPLWLSGTIPSFVDALFETVSGFTTTGASILTDVEAMPKSVLIWRSFTHWIGGMGVLVFVMAFLPLSGGSNLHIMKAESPGPVVGKLVPKIKTTALILYTIYFVLTVIEFIMLILGGMTVFDAINTSFSTAGTGGFGFLNSSMASFSPYIKIVVTVFMILFSINFASFYLLIKGKFRESLTAEVKVFLFIVIAAITIITINLSSVYTNTGEALLDSSFTVASIISTTGFATADFNQWPELSRTIIVLIGFIGACAGSTGGGFKVSRLVILFKGIRKELNTLIHPRQVKKIKMDSHTVDSETIRTVNVYLITYVVIFVASVVLISFENHDMTTNFTAVAATFNNVGPGLEMVGPTSNFAFFSDFSKIVFIFDMLIGRLELFPMLLLFKPSVWKK